jgi:diamine N-acetyltransferase
MPDSPPRIDRCRPADIPVVQRLADLIWRQHYPGIITESQIDYMLARGYSTEALSAFLDTAGSGLAIAALPEGPVGFAAWYGCADRTTKLDKLYVLPAMHGRGVGRALIRHVEQAARDAGSRDLVLNVNKGNAASIAAYERCGFERRQEVVVDIGNGFVMDDYVMGKAL